MVDCGNPIPVFVHIPKTAGSSIRIILREKFQEELYWSGVDYNADRVSELPLGRISFLGGHKHVAFYESAPQTFTFIAVVREPISRCLSFLNYAIQGPDQNLVQHYAKMDVRLENVQERILDRPPVNAEMNNLQCRYLKSARYQDSTFTNVLQTFRMYRFIVSTMENIPLMYEYLADMFALQFDKIPYDNVGAEGYQKDFSGNERLINLLNDLNQEDIQLYEFVKRKGLYTSNPC